MRNPSPYSLFISGVVLCWTAWPSEYLAAQDTTAQETGRQPLSPVVTDRADDIADDLGPLQPAHALLGETVTDHRGMPVGTLVDMALDPYTGMVAAFLVRPTETLDRDYRLLLPFELFAPLHAGQLRVRDALKARIADGPAIGRGANKRPYTRQLATVAYEFFGLTPYWQKPLDSSQEPRQDIHDHDQFHFLTHVQKQTVTGPNYNRLGVIQDIVLSTANGKIAYAVLKDQRSDQADIFRRYAIPLGAFVLNQDEGTWTIELPDASIDKTRPIEDAKWPTKIDMTWEKYVASRYGGHALDGVQRAD